MVLYLHIDFLGSIKGNVRLQIWQYLLHSVFQTVSEELYTGVDSRFYTGLVQLTKIVTDFVKILA